MIERYERNMVQRREGRLLFESLSYWASGIDESFLVS